MFRVVCLSLIGRILVVRCVLDISKLLECDVCVFSADHRNAPQIVIIYAIEAVSSFFPGPVLVPEGP